MSATPTAGFLIGPTSLGHAGPVFVTNLGSTPETYHMRTTVGWAHVPATLTVKPHSYAVARVTVDAGHHGSYLVGASLGPFTAYARQTVSVPPPPPPAHFPAVPLAGGGGALLALALVAVAARKLRHTGSRGTRRVAHSGRHS